MIKITILILTLWGPRRLRLPGFLDIRHLMVARSALSTGPPEPLKRHSWHLFLLEAGRIKSMKNPSDPHRLSNPRPSGL